MSSSREHEHFALDWIKSDLLETLNQARVALDEYAEQGADETRLRVCLTSLHQLHGTLLMLELRGVTMLSDHMEQAAQALFADTVEEPEALSQLLMQGILEMPGYLDELQRGAEDSPSVFVPLANDIRAHLGMEALTDEAGKSLTAGAGDETVEHFRRLDGAAKVARMRTAYQSVLLSILKGEDRSQAVVTLGKIASGLQKLTVGSSMERQWQAFDEFVKALATREGALDSDVVKLLRRVDLEIKSLASEGETVLKRPANLELVQQLLDATAAQDYVSDAVSGLRQAVERDSENSTLAISGRQALATAAIALRDELAVIKDKLDLIARASSLDLNALRDLIGPLKQIGSTLSLLGFESSREIMANQIDAVEQICVLGDADPAGVNSVASALMQIDENLNSVSTERSEIEQITGDAQIQLLREARSGLEQVKTAVVDFVSANWNTVHIADLPEQFRGICGALDIIPLPRVTSLLQDVAGYIENRLLQGHQPDWQELDAFADAISGVDYFLERLAEENTFGMDDILHMAERSLEQLTGADVAELASAPQPASEAAQADTLTSSDVFDASELTFASADAQSSETADLDAADLDAADEAEEREAQEEDAQTAEGAVETDAVLDDEDLPSGDEQEITLAQESDDAFDLESELFEDVEGAVAGSRDADEAAQSDADTQTPHDNLAFIADDASADAEEAQTADEPEADEPEQEVQAEAASESAEDEAVVDHTMAADSEAVADSEPVAEIEPPDPEIVEIFVEEVGEVLETIDEYLPQWANTLQPGEPLTEVRRAFHTLKGSGRIVQAVDIGELAWGIENMLNRVIEGTVEPNAQFVAVINEARSLVPSLADAFEHARPVDPAVFQEIIDRADVLASGGVLEEQDLADDSHASMADTAEVSAADAETDAPHAQEIDAQDSEQPLDFDTALEEADSAEDAPAVMDEAVVADSADRTADLEDLDAAAEEEQLSIDPDADAFAVDALLGDAFDTDSEGAPEQPADLDDAAGDEQEIAAQAETPETGVSEAEESEPDSRPEEDMDPAIAAFVGEADELLTVLEHELRVEPWSVSEPLARALHTLNGSAAAAKVDRASLLIEPANQLAEVYRNAEAPDELRDYYRSVTAALRECIDNLHNPEWEEPVELVAAADDLMTLALTKPRPVDDLLNSEAVNDIFAAEARLADICLGRESATDLINALSDVTRRAGSIDMPELSDLAAALLQCFTASTLAGGVGAEAQAQISQGYESLIEQLNRLAVGQDMQAQSALVDALLAIDFAAEASVADDAPMSQLDELAEAAADVDMAAEDEVDPADNVMPTQISDLDIDEDLVDVFFEEADEINEALETSMLNWADERENRIHMENMLRGLHTLKGGARLCGLSQVGDMAHDFETLVIEVQNDERSADDALFKEMQQRFDGIANYLAEVKDALFAPAGTAEVAAPPVEEISVEDLTTEPDAQAEPVAEDVLETQSEQADAAEAEADEVSASEDDAAASDEPPAELGNVASLVTEGDVEEKTALIQGAGAALKPVNQAPAPVERQERQAQEMVRVGASLLEELVNLAGENSILRARVEQGMSDFTSALDEMETTIERLREQLRRLEIETETQVLYRHEREDRPAYENFDPLEMDRYSQLQQLSRGLSESASDMLDLKDTLLFKARESETLLLQQARINTELQEGLMRTRMVPFNRLLPRLRRIVRQVAGELDKEVDFHVQNAEGELDRNLLERMVPPLEHMLRNAVDHGIENADMRRNFGKSATGRIDLRLSREGGDVVIEISDDGAGIDVESVRAKAVERGLCSADAILSDDEVTQFILAPGFSTAKSVTQISGRGVGMDVVNSEVKQLGGSIHISSRLGHGTRIVVRVPFTVSVNRALMVSVGEDLYALPLNTIEGIVLLSPEQLDALHKDEGGTFEYAGVPYRVRYLGQYLGRDYRGPQVGQTSVPVVLVRSGDHAVAIHVDAVQGSREIVVKSLGPQFAGVGGISGATILGDGSVVVILDLHALIRAQRQISQPREPRGTSAGRPRCVLVVDDSVTVRKVTSRLLERQGMDVIVAKDGVEAVALLQERRPDVMLLDIEMPRMDGFEVARQVRHDDRLVSLPIVMISSRTGDKHKEHADQLGVNKFLGKPFQENELLATIDELVSRV